MARLIQWASIAIVGCLICSGSAFQRCPEKCPPKRTCPKMNAEYCIFGSDLDPCGCCLACLKGPGDECGSIFGQYLCGDTLECKGEVLKEGHYKPGVCVIDKSNSKLLRRRKRQAVTGTTPTVTNTQTVTAATPVTPTATNTTAVTVTTPVTANVTTTIIASQLALNRQNKLGRHADLKQRRTKNKATFQALHKKLRVARQQRVSLSAANTTPTINLTARFEAKKLRFQNFVAKLLENRIAARQLHADLRQLRNRIATVNAVSVSNKTTTGLPVNGTVVPAGGATAPTNGAVVPAGGTTTPTNGATVPAGGATTPTNGVSVPAGGVTTPTNGVAVPAGGATTLTNGERVPTDGATVPAEVPAPTDGATAPTDGAATPTDGPTAPTDGAATPTDGATAPTDGATSPTDGAPVPTDGAPAPTDGTTIPTDVTTFPVN